MKIPPALFLFFLAPVIGELLSGSAPPVEFFNPISLLLLSSLYGSGTLIVRELKIRWNKSYVSTFIMGAAYGIIEEGLMVKSFFDPEWMDLGVLGVYGRWFEINWIWSEWLTIYHAIFSIAIPITLVELAYPSKRNKKWLSNAKLVFITCLLTAVTVFGYIFLTIHRPPFPQYLLSVLMVCALFLIAWKIPSEKGKKGKLSSWSPLRLTIIGFLTSLTIFLLFGAGPYIISQPPILMILGVAVIYVMFSFLKKFEWSEKTLYHKFALTTGALSFLIALTPLQELDKNRPDDTQGMLIVGILSLIILVVLGKKLISNISSLESSKQESKQITHHFFNNYIE